MRNKEITLAELTNRVEILGLCETWLKPTNSREVMMMIENVEPDLSMRTGRGFGGVAIKIHPLVK